jgi:hypothetical protein
MTTIETITYYSKVATTFYPLLPLFIATSILKKMKLAYRVFAAFILVSFLSDLGGFFINYNSPTFDNLKEVKYALYSLFDAMLPLLFLGVINVWRPKLRKIIAVTSIILLLIWCYGYLYNNPTLESSNLFDFSYCIINSILAANGLLLLAEEAGELKHLQDFWFLSGLFFYFFCANFMMALISTTIGKELWVLHNIVALISYALFTKGFLVLRKYVLKN